MLREILDNHLLPAFRHGTLAALIPDLIQGWVTQVTAFFMMAARRT